jgi:hypothetical protein
MAQEHSKPILVALYVVGGLLAANLLLQLAPRGPALPEAWAQPRQPPIAGGAGIFVMPAQLSGNTWGCYLLDVDRGTLCCYQYLPGSRELQFVAARNFRNDVQLTNFNTSPSPAEILNLVNKQGGPVPPTP